MSKHFQKEISIIKRDMLKLAAMVEESLDLAVKSVLDRDYSFARQVIDSDFRIDNAEVEIEEECLKILALHQPVAIDLRFIVAVLKMNSDLERIGDLAVNIAEHSCFLALQEQLAFPFDFAGMSEKAQFMLKTALDSLVNMDARSARQVCATDDQVDEINRSMYKLVEAEIKKNPGNVNLLMHYLCISRHLERIADHATNIAEDVIYMIEGEIVRHLAENFAESQE